MVQGSTESEPHADWRIPKPFAESLTEPCRAELKLSFDGKEGVQSYRLLIEAPTLKDVYGIFQVAYARTFTIALQDQSNGDSSSD